MDPARNELKFPRSRSRGLTALENEKEGNPEVGIEQGDLSGNVLRGAWLFEGQYLESALAEQREPGFHGSVPERGRERTLQSLHTPTKRDRTLDEVIVDEESPVRTLTRSFPTHRRRIHRVGDREHKAASRS